jgi:hypothetical protein
LESLDGRIVPSADYFLGGDPQTPSDWSLGRYPSYGDDVIFDGTYTSDDCTLSPIGPYHSLQMVNGYSGTVTHTTLMSLGSLVIEGGTLTPYSSSSNDITVTQNFTWTGGTINFTSYASTLTVTGSTATATIAPTNGGIVTLGSSISFENGAAATLNNGTIATNKDNLQFSTSTGSSVLMAPTGLGSVVLGVAQFYLHSEIGSGTSWTIQANADVTMYGQLTNTGGTYTLLSGASVEITTNPLSPFGSDRGYVQVGGATAATYLHGNSRLATDGLIVMDSGTLATVYDSDAGTVNATIGA